MTKVGKIRKTEEGTYKLVEHCADLRSHEKALIVSDPETKSIGLMIEEIAKRITSSVEHHCIAAFSMHGQELPPDTAKAMYESDVIFGVTHMSMIHTQARLRATAKGARYLSLPDYSLDVLGDISLMTDFRGITSFSNRIADILNLGSEVKITSDIGTELYLRINGRTANACPGWTEKGGTVASPPDAETNIAIVEQFSEGRLVVNGSIPYDGIGLVKDPIICHIAKGVIERLEGTDKGVAILEKILWEGEDSYKKRVLAELGFGLNDKARLCGVMLIDEGTCGTIHIGIGSNATIGGVNDVNSHLDLVINKPTVAIDGGLIMVNGEYLK